MVKGFWISEQSRETDKNFIQILYRISPAFYAEVNIFAAIIFSTMI